MTILILLVGKTACALLCLSALKAAPVDINEELRLTNADLLRSMVFNIVSTLLCIKLGFLTFRSRFRNYKNGSQVYLLWLTVENTLIVLKLKCYLTPAGDHWGVSSWLALSDTGKPSWSACLLPHAAPFSLPLHTGGSFKFLPSLHCLTFCVLSLPLSFLFHLGNHVFSIDCECGTLLICSWLLQLFGKKWGKNYI